MTASIEAAFSRSRSGRPTATSGRPRWAAILVKARASWPLFPATTINCFFSIDGSARCFEKAEAIATVNAPAQWLPPGTVVEIPLDCALDAALEVFLRLPTKVAESLRSVDGIAKIMAGTIGDESNKRPPRTCRRNKPINDFTYCLDDREVGTFAAAAQKVLLTRTPTI